MVNTPDSSRNEMDTVKHCTCDQRHFKHNKLSSRFQGFKCKLHSVLSFKQHSHHNHHNHLLNDSEIIDPHSSGEDSKSQDSTPESLSLQSPSPQSPSLHRHPRVWTELNIADITSCLQANTVGDALDSSRSDPNLLNPAAGDESAGSDHHPVWVDVYDQDFNNGDEDDQKGPDMFPFTVRQLYSALRRLSQEGREAIQNKNEAPFKELCLNKTDPSCI